MGPIPPRKGDGVGDSPTNQQQTNPQARQPPARHWRRFVTAPDEERRPDALMGVSFLQAFLTCGGEEIDVLSSYVIFCNSMSLASLPFGDAS